MNMKNNPKMLGLILALVAMAIYGKTILFGFVWDDKSLIVENPYLRQPIHFFDIFSNAFWNFSQLKREGTQYYRPVTNLLFIAEFKLWGLQSWLYHFLNILFHIFSALLLFFICNRIFKDTCKSFLISLIFISHPAVSTTVSWISSQSDLLCVSLLLLSFMLWMEKGKHRFYLAIPVLFLSMLSKETAVLGPLLFLSYDYFFDRMDRKSFTPLLLIPVYFMLRGLVLTHVIAPGSEISLDAFTRTLLYIGRILLPTPMAPREILQNFSLYVQIGSALALIVMIFGTLVFTKNRPRFRFYIVWFLIAIVPIAGWTSGNLRFSDQLLYFAMVPSSIAIGWLLTAMNFRIFSIFTILILASISFVRIGIWKNDLTLWSYNVSRFPNDTKTNINYGVALFDTGNLKKACLIFDRLGNREKEDVSAKEFSLIHYNAGNCQSEKQPQKAIGHFHKALEATPSMWPARFNLILLLQQMKQYDKAKAESIRFTQISPELSISWKTLGYSSYYLKDFTLSRQSFEKAVELNKDDADSLSMLKVLSKSASKK